jgi:MtN3 and saliva related transmembrane protein
MEIIGWIGSLALALCGLPQAIKAIRERNSDGISNGFLILWCIGEIFTILYILPLKDIPLLINYSINLVFVSIIGYFKLKGANNG